MTFRVYLHPYFADVASMMRVFARFCVVHDTKEETHRRKNPVIAACSENSKYRPNSNARLLLCLICDRADEIIGFLSQNS